jgi:hypothetical protein
VVEPCVRRIGKLVKLVQYPTYPPMGLAFAFLANQSFRFLPDSGVCSHKYHKVCGSDGRMLFMPKI